MAERAHYRIDYPEAERPSFVVGDRSLSVLDCSEKGIAYRDPDTPPDAGARVEGVVRFRGGRDVAVAGEVVWARRGRVALALEGDGIPAKLLFDEQRYLRAHYPMRF